MSQQEADAKRLERLWAEDFGDQYVDRNAAAGDRRGGFWNGLLGELNPRRVLEIGCNLGGNLQWVVRHATPHDVYGVDVNSKALAELSRRIPGVNTIYSPGRDLPLRDRWFDLTFTMGVLIHQPEATLPLVMNEVVRTSRRWVLCGEYFAANTTEVPYRGQPGALFKRDYGRLYRELFPELQLRREGKLGKEEGFDDVTYWLFERS